MAGTDESQDTSYKDSRKRIVILSAIVAVLFVLIIFTIVWKNFFKQKEHYDSWDIYAVVGPIHTTTAKAGEIRMTLSINCLNPETQKIVMGKRSQIKDRLLLSMNTAGVDEIITKRDYEALKVYIRDEIIVILGGKAIGDVYFSDLLVY